MRTVYFCEGLGVEPQSRGITFYVIENNKCLTMYLDMWECLQLMGKLSEVVYQFCNRREEDQKYYLERAKKDLEWLKERGLTTEKKEEEIKRRESRLRDLVEVKARLYLFIESIKKYLEGGEYVE